MIEAQRGLKADYYDGRNFDRYVTSRVENKIDMFWNQVPPVEGIDPHDCSIRWTGWIRPAKSGIYSFYARVDDGIRVWIDDELVISNWKLNDVGISNGSARLKKDQFYKLKVEYFNALIEGEITLLWDIPQGNVKWYNRWFQKKDYEIIQPGYFHLTPDPSKINEGPPVQSEPELIADVSSEVSISEEPPSQIVASRESNTEKTMRESQIEESLEQESANPTDDLDPTPERIDDFIPKNILFERTKVTILEESYHELNRFADFMLEHPEINVKIEGHTDPVGNEEENFLLSERRAYAVARYLVKKNVAADRISAEGFGGSRPLQIPEDGRYVAKNRRVEFIVSGHLEK